MPTKNSRVLACRIPGGIYEEFVRLAKLERLTPGEKLKNVVVMGVQRKRVNTPEKIPIYDARIHKAGDRVLVRKGKSLVETVVPELDADGNILDKG